MAARAQEISLEAGSKIAAAMKDVIGAAAGLTGFALESARDLVQYMVRRGQMTQDEADKLIREVEESQGPRKPGAPASRPPQPRPVEMNRAEPSRPQSASSDSDGRKHIAAAPPTAVAKPSLKASPRPAKAQAKPAKKAATRSAPRPKPAAARKSAAKAKKKR
jgi:polyhydroxyalkanoate synthesis regulator phasin